MKENFKYWLGVKKIKKIVHYDKHQAPIMTKPKITSRRQEDKQ